MNVVTDFKKEIGSVTGYILVMNDGNNHIAYQKNRITWTSDINEADRAPLASLAEFFDDTRYTIIEEKLTREIVTPKIELTHKQNYRNKKDDRPTIDNTADRG